MGWNTMMGSVQMPLPFFNRNQGNVASAVAEIRAAEADTAAVRALVLAELRSAAAEAQNRRRQLTDFFPGVLQQANESSRISQAAYREGGSDLLRLLDTERVRIEAQVMYYRTLAEYRQSLANLDAALGVAP
jgi:outer membrane protein, heavy metal efflux system